jgi:hypothetical protein
VQDLRNARAFSFNQRLKQMLGIETTNVLKGDLIIPDNATISDASIELLYMLLEENPLDRATLAEIKGHRLFDDV